MSSTLGPGHGPNHLTALATSGKHIWFLFSQGLVGGRRKRLVMYVPQGCLGSESQERPGVTQLWAGTAAASASDAEPGSVPAACWRVAGRQRGLLLRCGLL